MVLHFVQRDVQSVLRSVRVFSNVSAYVIMIQFAHLVFIIPTYYSSYLLIIHHV